MKNDELSRAAWRVVADSKLALLTTADKEGWPHCTWMNFELKGYIDEIFSITAPTSQKVSNLRANPRAEWMFATPPLETVVYLSGPTRIIEGEEMLAYWNAMPGKSHAFYRQYCETDDFRRFVVVSTKIEKVIHTHPAAYRKNVAREP